MSQKLVACFFQIYVIKGQNIFLFFSLALRNINAVYQLKKLIELYSYQFFNLVDMKVVGALTIKHWVYQTFSLYKPWVIMD
jgi:hypothetical protein